MASLRMGAKNKCTSPHVVTTLPFQQTLKKIKCRRFNPFSSPEAALLFITTKNPDPWKGPTLEARDSWTSLTLPMLRVKSDKSGWLKVRNEFSAHAQKIRPGERRLFLVLTKRSTVSGDENGIKFCLLNPRKY